MKDIEVNFPNVRRDHSASQGWTIRAVDGVSLQLRPGVARALVVIADGLRSAATIMLIVAPALTHVLD